MRVRARRGWLAAALVSALVAGCGAGTPDPSTPAPSSATPVSAAPTVSVPALPPDTGLPSSSVPLSTVPSPASGSSRTAAPAGPAKPTMPAPPKVVSTVRIGSGGALAVTHADVAAATAAVAAMSPAERAGSVLVVIGSTVDDTSTLADLHLGGVILGGSKGILDGTGTGTPDQVAALTTGLQNRRAKGAPPLLIGTDQEYGDVSRLVHGFTEFPGASQLAAIPDTGDAARLTGEIASAAAAEMLAVGVTVDFAPDADVLPSDDTESAIGNRSYGSDPARVAQLVTAAVTGYQRAGVAATIKHFPGIGRISSDTHTSLPSLDVDCDDWNATEAVPMRAGVDAGVALAMTGHVHMPAVGVTTLPASLAPQVVTDLLRGNGRDGCDGLSFDGVTITDALQMQPVVAGFDSGGAAVQALRAGEDLLLMPLDAKAAVQGIVTALSNGKLPGSRLTDAAVRVYALRLALQRVQRPSMEVINSPAHRQLADQAAALAGG